MATTKTGERRCAARPNGPYGIDAKRQCPNATHRATAALCRTHERAWAIESKRRRAERAAAIDAANANESNADATTNAATIGTDAIAANDADDTIAARNARALRDRRRAARVA